MSWIKETVLENKRAKLTWDFEFKTRKRARTRRSDLLLEDLEEKKLFFANMTYPMDEKTKKELSEKLTNYQQITYEMNENRRGFYVIIV